ncbi:MAG TPA: DUF4255 domain-containing protein [Longimicrobiales bacterium]|nr:DUF4255 domain-containing protein [Longimicrobiales bacterium]
MALLDLSLVTRALVRVLEEHIAASPAWQPRPTPSVTPLPPDRIAVNQLGLYLYHVREEPHTRNVADPGLPGTPVRHQPLGLTLYYQMAVNGTESAPTMYEAQLLFGCGLKAFHDVPVLDDSTVVNGVNILQAVGLDGAGNRIRVRLQPVEETDAADYWTAGSTSVRTAAYYEASVVLLESEPPPVRTGRVRHYGVQTFVRGAPRLTASENRLEFNIPGVAVPQELVLRPAEVPVGEQFTLHGSDLSGDDVQIVLRSARWTEDRVTDAGWGVLGADTRLIATVRETVDGEAVLPGIHSARVRVTTYRTMPDGSVRAFPQTSNAVPLTITPRIDGISAPDAAGVFQLQGYTFQHAELEPEDVELFFGPDRATPGTAGSLNPGEFAITADDTIEARLPAGLASGSHVPLRVLVNGAESAPRWVEVP